MPEKTTRIAQAIKATLQTVAGIGQVYDYEVIPADKSSGYEGMRQAFMSNGKINGIHFWRETHATRRSAVGTDMSPHENLIVWTFDFWFEVEGQGASTATVDDLVDLMRQAFQNNLDLGGEVDTIIADEAVGLQVTERETSNFLGPNCHRVNMSMNTLHYDD